MRGNPHVKGDKIEPAFPVILNAPAPVLPQPPANAQTSGRRRVLADWIASRDNQLTPRVMANRLWQYHFGRGIVRSPSNFGLQGDRPTHRNCSTSGVGTGGQRLAPETPPSPDRDVERLPHVVACQPGGAGGGPGQRPVLALRHAPLTAEEIRDTILSLTARSIENVRSGRLPRDPAGSAGGPVDAGPRLGQVDAGGAGAAQHLHSRQALAADALLERFDVAETDRSSPVRFATTQPTQALTMINSTFLNKQAELLAARLRREAGEDTGKQVTLALRLATTREPSADEVRRGVRLIEGLPRPRRGDGRLGTEVFLPGGAEFERVGLSRLTAACGGTRAPEP